MFGRGNNGTFDSDLATTPQKLGCQTTQTLNHNFKVLVHSLRIANLNQINFTSLYQGYAFRHVR